MKKGTITLIAIKSIFLILYSKVFDVINTAISPIIKNYLALNQLNNSIDSSLGIKLYSELNQYSWVVILVAAFVLFFEDIANITKYFMKEVHNNEEI